MAGFIGNLGVFDHKSQDWQIFHSRLAQFLLLNSVSEDKKKCAVLLTHLSDESYRLTSNLLHPEKLETVAFVDLVKVLDDHFTPRRSTFGDRAKFYDATIMDGESVEDWAARLRGLAVFCEFGSALDILLRDRFVLGLKAGPERDRLFEQDSKTLTLAKALEVAQQAACARAARASLAQAEPRQFKEEPVFRASAGRAGSSRAAVGLPDDGPRCSICGRRNHDAAKCRFKSYRCQSCGQKGHLKKVCANKGNGGRSRLHCMQAESDDSDNKCVECELFNTRYVNSYSPIKLPVTVNGVQIMMELDSGSGTSVICEELYLKYFTQIKLLKTDLRMCLYNGHKITPLGYFTGEVCYLTTAQHLKMYVVKNGGPPLLGRL
jgi:hypothetical protein